MTELLVDAADDPPFVDAHVHFWDHAVAGLGWPWLEPGFTHPRLREMHRLDAARYGPPELREEAGTTAPDKVVHVQCAAQTEDPALETRWLSGVADATGWPDAFVAFCRLRSGSAPAVLAANAAFARFRGVRDMSVTGAVEPSEVVAGLDAAAELGVLVELQVPYEHYGALRALAEHWPTITFVLGHAGQPEQRTPEYLAAWSQGLAELARAVPNVVVKVSAIASAADPHWTADSIRPLVLTCLEAFGAERSMLATNWPIDRLHGRYPDLVAAYRTVVAELSGDDQAAVLHRTAERLYRI
jgi:predicted TIM-barrel fold metal-dependent hydrolase